MPYFVLGVAILIGLGLAGRWYINAAPSAVLRVFKVLAILLVFIIIAVIILTKQFAWVALAAPVALFFMRLRRASNLAKNLGRMAGSVSGNVGSGAGQTSEIETKYLRMYLLHETGEMNGDIILGKFSGRTLRNLTFEDLCMLMAEIGDDNHSVQVLNSYLERYHSERWEAEKPSRDESKDEEELNNAMTQKEAYKVLGLTEQASEDDIKDAHRRLMSKIHPDHGGSTYLATKLNQAKELLLNK